MSQSTTKTKVKSKIGRPSFNRTKKELKEYLRVRSKEYYSKPEIKEKQRLKMEIYRNKNRERINQRRRAKRIKDKLEKKLKRIWLNRDLLKK